MISSTRAASLWDAAADACLLTVAAGSALNLAAGQGALALLCLLLLARSWVADAAWTQTLKALGSVWWLPLGFVGACVLSSVVTVAPWPGLFDATRWRGMLAIPACGVALALRGPTMAVRCAQVFAAGCALHACVGAWQVWSGATPLADLLHIPLERRVIPAPDRPDLRAAGGLFYNRVRLSHVLSAGAATAFAVAAWSVRGRVAWLLCGAMATVGLVLTYGRAALGALVVAVALGGLVVALRSGPVGRRRVWSVMVAGALAGAGVLVAVPPVRDRMASAVDVTRNLDRLFLWARGSEMAVDHAPYGTGFGGYSVVRDAYYNRVQDTVESRAMSHNQYISLLAEAGVLGLLLWLWMWGALFLTTWRNPALANTAGALGAFTFHAATLAHDPLYQAECALAWAFCGALMMSMPQAAPVENRT